MKFSYKYGFFILLFFSTFAFSQVENKEIFTLAEHMPRFPGCEDKSNEKDKTECSTKKMMEYIYANIKYPVEAIKNDIQGRVTLRFTVNTDSTISNIEVLRDIGGGCGEEAKRVIESMNSLPLKWIPGSQGVRNVNVWYTLPIVFKLNNDQKNTNYPPNNFYSIPCDQGPIFPLCTNLPTRSEMAECSQMKMLEFIYSNINYPALAASHGLEGRVVLSFMVTTDGNIENVQIVNDIGGGCGEEAKRVIESMNNLTQKWIPGSQNGKNINVWFTIPVIFKFNG